MVITPVPERIFITGIGTDVGKTLVSAIFVKALEADYWKPIQCGSLEQSDLHEVRRLVGTCALRVFHPEAFALPDPVSPHLAAARAGREIKLCDISLPETGRPLVIEGAGGLLVPLNQHEMVIDIATKFSCAVVLVSRNYVGSINHTLLSIEALSARNIPVAGLVFNGGLSRETEKNEEFILQKSGLPLLLRVPALSAITAAMVKTYADELRRNRGL
jgi:dethiobiotin synthetase